MMIEKGTQACFVKDKKGYLPAHVACSRHCSPAKLLMLLAVNPHALYTRTAKGDTLMDLATKTASKSHPNYALIDELKRQLELTRGAAGKVQSVAATGYVSPERRYLPALVASDQAITKPPALPRKMAHRKRKVAPDPAVSLLLHFSRASTNSPPRRSGRKAASAATADEAEDYDAPICIAQV
jgi:hypothetical protein